MNDQFDFKGKSVCITGAGGGIGGAIAGEFARLGADLALVFNAGKNPETPVEFLAKCIGFSGDISDHKFVRRLVAETIKVFGKIDVLINAAAILGPVGLISETDPKQWSRAIEVNLGGTYLLTREVLPHMIERKKGKIINFAGGGAAYSYPRFSAYACSKVAVVRFSETVADEVRQFGVQINCVAPGAVETKILGKVRAAGGEIRNVVDMDKPVKLVVFLASNMSDHITGRFIHSNDDYMSLSADMDDDFFKLRRLPLKK